LKTATETSQNKKFFNKKDLQAYFFVAGTGALVQFACSSVLQNWFGLSFGISLHIAYWISMIVGFVLTKMFAFDARNTEKTNREMAKFLLVGLFSGEVMVLSAYLVLKFLNFLNPSSHIIIPFSTKSFNFNQFFSHGMGMGFSFLSNYLLHQIFTFKSTGFYDRLKNAFR
jgi:putative flippase GtrA